MMTAAFAFKPLMSLVILLIGTLGATQNQLNRIIPGYADSAERLLAGGTSVDGTQIRGELGIL